MNAYERIAALTAIKKACEAELKELRAETDGELVDAYNGTGLQKVALKVNGTKVGEYTVPLSKPSFKVIDEEAFDGFALDYGLARTELRTVYEGDWQERMTQVGGKVYLEDSGLEVPGVAYCPERPMTPKVTGCDPRKVIPLAMQLEGGVAGLLGE